MPKLTINGQEVEVPEGFTVLQAAQMVDMEIPVFCYHPRLAIAGNCRMCLLEIEHNPKPIASCALPAADDMVVYTNTPKVKKARQGVLEFLLINHPLDCPICDQGGECDLQDITMAYGPSTSRYEENKRAVSDKYMGPLIKTFMTRCIHCTRCIRFSEDIAGTTELGAVDRGEHMEIVSYLDSAVTSELSGNLVDVCPVGALTSKPYQFRGRPWELEKTESIDTLDAVGSNIVICSSGLQILRVLPRLHEGINEEWISDKTRYAFDGLTVQRLDQPYVRRQGSLKPTSWEDALAVVAARLKNRDPRRIAALVGDMADCEAMVGLKDLLDRLGVENRDCRYDRAAHDPTCRAGYLFNTTIEGIEKSDFCLIIGANVRADAAMVHARLRKRYLKGGFHIAYLGGKMPLDRDFTFDYEDLGDELQVLDALLSQEHPLAKMIKKAQYPMLIIGDSALTRPDGMNLLTRARELADAYEMIRADWNGFNILHRVASRVGGLDIGFIPGKSGLDTAGIFSAVDAGEIDTLYLLGVDDIDFTHLKKTFIIYQGHHGDTGAAHADVILPGAAYTEKSATYVNMEGRVQKTLLALCPPGEAKEDWKIIKALSDTLQIPLPYSTLEEVRAHMARLNPIFATWDVICPATWGKFGKKGKVLKENFNPEAFRFYMTDIISRHSKTMAQCAQEFGLSHV
jgi:NADH-quinone oxidoreductase subunit G